MSPIKLKKNSSQTATATTTMSQSHITGSFANCTTTQESQHQQAINGNTVTVSCQTFAYKLVQESFQKASDGSIIIVGVMSAAKNFQRRQVIRNTWAHNTTRVFFLVSGPFADIADEFDAHEDLIWIDQQEHYKKITEKTASFIYLVDHVATRLNLRYSHVTKVDDDTYLAVDRLEARMDWLQQYRKGGAPDFWGVCHYTNYKPVRDPDQKWYTSQQDYPEDMYPPYCQGGGYALSQKFAHCAAKEMPHMRYMVHEDCFIGLLAERCGLSPEISMFDDQDLAWIYRSGKPQSQREKDMIINDQKLTNADADTWLPKPDMGGRILQHYLISDRDFHDFHQSYLLQKSNHLKHIQPLDTVEYYYGKDGFGWLKATIKNVTTNSNNQSTVWLEFDVDGHQQNVLFDSTFSGRWRKPILSQTYDPLVSHMGYYTDLENTKPSGWNFTSESIRRLEDTVSELEKFSAKYYIYDDPEILQTKSIKTGNFPKIKVDHIHKDMDAENEIMDALATHPFRVKHASEAEYFVVPLSFSKMLVSGCRFENCRWIDHAVDALERQPSFQKLNGNNHVIVSIAWLAFNDRYSAIFPALARNFRRIQNVTVAHNYDPFGVIELKNQTSSNDPAKAGFHHLYPQETPVTRAFSLGLGYDAVFPIRQPSLSGFENSKYFLFYHSRDTKKQGFGFGSGKYRDAVFNTTVLDNLPLSSVGRDISKKTWVQHIKSSQFCLVVRGDTPHSHALLYAIRAGCIPVVVSDDYESYAGPLKSSLSMKDFCIFLSEDQFLRDPLSAIQSLFSLTHSDLENILRALKIVQRVLFLDHGEGSLFVPAFLRELEVSQKKSVTPSTGLTKHIEEEHVMVGAKNISYQYASPIDAAIQSAKGGPKIVAIVPSDASFSNYRQAAHRRRAIRWTWGRDHRVLFVAHGKNDKEAEVRTELQDTGDLVWMPGNHSKRDAVLLGLAFVESQMVGYDYVLVINDDGFVHWPDVPTRPAPTKRNISSRLLGEMYKFGKLVG